MYCVNTVVYEYGNRSGTRKTSHCNEGSEACGSICSLTLINLDRVKQAVIKQQCQEYQRQGRDINNTGQESGQAATQSEFQRAISQGQASENQQR